MKKILLTCVILALAANVGAIAQTQSVESTVKGQSGKDIQIGIYINVQPDCTSGPLPTIRVSEPPTHGKVEIKKGSAAATNYRQCLALQVPAYVATYRSDDSFAGTDTLVLEIKFSNGKTEIQHVKVMVGASGTRQPI